MRPESIRWFERVYIGRIIIGLSLYVYAILWGIDHGISALPTHVRLTAWIIQLLGMIVLNGLLFYFIGRRASTIAKWIFIVTSLIVAVSVIRIVIAPNFLPAALKMGPLFGVGLDFTMIMLLFQPDARNWFERRGMTDEDYAETFS
jgi:hypothetical protein